jgi:enoyl-CoA hydratase
MYKNRFVLVEEIDVAIGLVTLNDPPLNLNSPASLRELWETLEKLARDPRVRALVLTGAGGRAFSAGSDLTGCKGTAASPAFSPEAAALNSLEFIDKPTICAVEGYCMGSGLELACCCDIRVVSEKAVFSRPEIAFGLYPAAGGRCRLRDVVGPARALEMMYFGEPIDAVEAYRIGLANRIVPAGAALISALDLADVMTGKAPDALRAVKEEARRARMHAPVSKRNAGPDYDDDETDYSSAEADYSNAGPDYSNAGPDYGNAGSDCGDAEADCGDAEPDYGNAGSEYGRADCLPAAPGGIRPDLCCFGGGE